MREILFRAKRIDNGEWVEGLLLTNKLGTYIITEENPHECTQYGYIVIEQYYRVDPATVGQCTELKDSNGKRIFEGDVVRFTRNVRVGTRRSCASRNSRTYESYGIYEDKTLSGVVRIGKFKKLSNAFAHIAYVEVAENTSYDSYFFGSGRVSDKPFKTTDNLSEAISDNKSYEIIGTIHDEVEP